MIIRVLGIFKYFLLFFLMNSKSIAQFEERIQLDLIFAEPGDTIKIEPGSYDILGALSIVGKKNIVLKGSGIKQHCS